MFFKCQSDVTGGTTKSERFNGSQDVAYIFAYPISWTPHLIERLFTLFTYVRSVVTVL